MIWHEINFESIWFAALERKSISELVVPFCTTWIKWGKLLQKHFSTNFLPLLQKQHHRHHQPPPQHHHHQQEQWYFGKLLHYHNDNNTTQRIKPESSPWSKLGLIWEGPRLKPALNWNWPFPGQRGDWNGGEGCRRFGQISLEREFQRIDSVSASAAPSSEYCSPAARKLQNYPPSILSNYIHAIYGMLYDIYFRYFWIRKFFQKNAPYNVCYCSFIEECPLLRV